MDDKKVSQEGSAKVRTPIYAWAWPGRTHMLAVDGCREGLLLRPSFTCFQAGGKLQGSVSLWDYGYWSSSPKIANLSPVP